MICFSSEYWWFMTRHDMARIDNSIHWWLQWCFLTGRLSALRVVGSLYRLLHCHPLHCLFSIEISNISYTTYISYRTLSFLFSIPKPFITSLHLLCTEMSFVLICLYLPWLTRHLLGSRHMKIQPPVSLFDNAKCYHI